MLPHISAPFGTYSNVTLRAAEAKTIALFCSFVTFHITNIYIYSNVIKPSKFLRELMIFLKFTFLFD